MSTELNFEAMPFEAYDGFRTLASEQSGFELEEEFGRRSGRVGSSQRLSRGIAKQSQKRPSISSSGGRLRASPRCGSAARVARPPQGVKSHQRASEPNRRSVTGAGFARSPYACTARTAARQRLHSANHS